MDFVTICFTKDLPQMAIQAASMDRYLRKFPVDNIFVVINDLDFDSCQTYFNKNVRHKYGELQSKVNLIDGSKLLRLSYGYLDQMKLKILIAQLCNSSDYCILDTKNYLIKEWLLEKVYKEGKFISTVEPVYPAMYKSFEYFNLDITEYTVFENITPYFTPTKISKLLTETALSPWGITSDQYNYLEFYLMQAAMIYHGIDTKDYYFNHTAWRTGIWPVNYQNFTYTSFINTLFSNNPKEVIVLGIHREVFAKLDDNVLSKQQKIWNAHRIATYEESKKIIEELRTLNPNC
jgi:hypothetical protein